jgi:hypothetical protein
MDLHRYWNGKATDVRLLPVYPKTGNDWDEPDACEENQAFWDATPSGEATVRYGSTEPADVPFELGKAYYIDMTPSDGEARWKLEVNSQYEGQLDVKLSAPWRNGDGPVIRTGSIEMSIVIASTWPAFKDTGPGTHWDVAFSEAPG